MGTEIGILKSAIYFHKRRFFMRQKRIGCLPVLMAISLIVILVIGWIYYKDGKTYTDLKTEVTYKKKEIKNKKKG